MSVVGKDKPSVKKCNSSFSCCQRAIRVKFYRNGDRFFTGFTFPISFNRYREFDVLLKDLSSSNFCDKTILPCGVRAIFAQNGSRIKSVVQMEEGGMYICSSTNTYIPIDYANETRNPKWKTTKKFVDNVVPVLPLRTRFPKLHTSNSANFHGSVPSVGNHYGAKLGAKIITIIRNGTGRPRQIFQWLLNCRTAPTFGKVLDDLSALLKLDSGCVKHIYTVDGKQILSLEDLFYEETVFIAFGSDIIDRNDIFLTCQELAQIEKSKKPFVRALADGKDDFSEPNGLQKLTDKYLVGNEIAIGSFSVVKECKEKKKETVMALKIIDRKKCEKNKEKLDREISIMKRLKHVNVLSLINKFETQDFIYLVLELCQDGNMVDFIINTQSYSEQDVSGMIHNIASGLNYLHSINIVHRDIKFENVLIQKDSTGLTRLRICDFGLACEFSDKPLLVVCGSPHYMAPEILMQTGYDNKVDNWSLGIMLYILLFGSPPFLSESNEFNEIFERILKGDYDVIAAASWKNVSDEAKALLERLLEKDPKKRYSADDIIYYPWVAKDIAGITDLWPLVGKRITKFFTGSYENLHNPYSFLAKTALDKDSNFFETEDAEG